MLNHSHKFSLCVWYIYRLYQDECFGFMNDRSGEGRTFQEAIHTKHTSSRCLPVDFFRHVSSYSIGCRSTDQILHLSARIVRPLSVCQSNLCDDHYCVDITSGLIHYDPVSSAQRAGNGISQTCFLPLWFLGYVETLTRRDET